MNAPSIPFDRQSHWDGRYRRIGSERVSWHEAEPSRSLEIVAASGVPVTAAVIDVGGGASNLAGELIARGHVGVTVLDISEEAIRDARSRVQDPDAIEWLHADLLDWTPPRRWGLWHDRAVFHFLTEPDERVVYRRLLRDALTPGGVVLITTFAADGPESCSDLPVRRYDATHLLDELGPGFTEITRGRYIHTTPSGGEQPMTWVAARFGAQSSDAANQPLGATSDPSRGAYWSK